MPGRYVNSFIVMYVRPDGSRSTGPPTVVWTTPASDVVSFGTPLTLIIPLYVRSSQTAYRVLFDVIVVSCPGYHWTAPAVVEDHPNRM